MKKAIIVIAAFVTSLFLCSSSGCKKDWSEPVVEVVKPKPTDPSGGGDSGTGNPSGTPDPASPVNMSFIIMGDLHYCEARFYDLDAMLAEKPSDYRQITQTYDPVTKANWKDQIAIVADAARKATPAASCIVQLGDISEGLGNTAGGPDAIARNVISVLRETDSGCPWVLVKGNHDITGVGDACKAEAKAAFPKYYTPFIKEQTAVTDITDATYAYEVGGVLFVVLDAYNSSQDQTAFAKKALESSRAKYKFVCLHEPVIPATERCWHYLRSKSTATREAFLKVIAENKAYVLCGHLHRYSVLRRNTEWGPIVQVMANSVTNVARTASTSNTLDGVQYYGTYLCDTYKPDYSPSNHETRHAQLEAEAPFVDYYKMNTLAGYGIITVNSETDKVILKYYQAFNDGTPYDTVDLTELYHRQ